MPDHGRAANEARPPLRIAGGLCAEIRADGRQSTKQLGFIVVWRYGVEHNMAYVRKRGRQLALVHGARDPATGKVEQQIIFTIYSKAEALEVLGRRGGGEGARRFAALLQDRYP